MTSGVYPRPSITERIRSRCESAGECFLWRGVVGNSGYGLIRHIGKYRLVHRVVYELINGPIPNGMQIDHLCGVQICVNPAHLEAVTPRENTLRSSNPAAINARKTRCKRGHELIPAGAERKCMTCRREAQRKRRRAAK